MSGRCGFRAFLVAASAVITALARRAPQARGLQLDVDAALAGQRGTPVRATGNRTSATWALGLQGRACLRTVSDRCAVLSPLLCGE
eukprot:CAMPEP_0168393380 /NCGR_PEP_ID=MMETSP0228-20121227/18988_1 /TAXON_ID=133427 /ORGANISM="Protoceratium reticulatum, Strain CCCM 535 (=CCMP 1889)" /LENGTH=85 /DNA_ID=CAMNT_0008406759 /DNA_START=62 /DNA_END=316 /DNA_ORIENTATION=-